MYSISTSSAARRPSDFRCGSRSARKSTRNRMPSGKALKRCNSRRRGDTVARRKWTSAAASWGVPMAAAMCAWAAFTTSGLATNCSLISNHRSRRSSGLAVAYQWAITCARLPPSTSLTWVSTMALKSSSVRRKRRGDIASSGRRRLPLRRSASERVPGLPPGATGLAGCLVFAGLGSAPWVVSFTSLLIANLSIPAGT